MLLEGGVTSRRVDFSNYKNVRWLTPHGPVQVLHRKGEHLARAATSKKPNPKRGARPATPANAPALASRPLLPDSSGACSLPAPAPPRTVP